MVIATNIQNKIVIQQSLINIIPLVLQLAVLKTNQVASVSVKLKVVVDVINTNKILRNG